MEETLNEYFNAIFRRWWWLVVDIAGGVLFITGLLGKTVPVTLPIGIFIIFVGFSVAQFLAFHDLRKVKAKLEEDLKEAKMYEAKSQRIENSPIWTDSPS